MPFDEEFWAKVATATNLGGVVLLFCLILRGEQRFKSLTYAAMGLAVSGYCFNLYIDDFRSPTIVPALVFYLSFAGLLTGIIGGMVGIAKLILSREKKLPPPFYDPLLAAKPGLWTLWIFWAARLAIGLDNASAAHSGALFFGTFAVAVIGAATLVYIEGKIPTRPVDGLFLRSFDTDIKSVALRRHLIAQINKGLRLSGIRAPKRRMLMITRAAALVLLILRYGRSRHLDLEAGRDWRARLWRSLALCRFVIIEVHTISKSLRFEVELANDCSGTRRIFFVGDTSRPIAEWRRYISDDLLHDSEILDDQIHVAIWDYTKQQSEDAFDIAVKNFIAQLPSGVPGECYAAFGNIAGELPSFAGSASRLIWDFFIIALGVLIVAVLQLFFEVWIRMNF
jgi:hypothetical protein